MRDFVLPKLEWTTITDEAGELGKPWYSSYHMSTALVTLRVFYDDDTSSWRYTINNPQHTMSGAGLFESANEAKKAAVDKAREIITRLLERLP